MTKTMTPRTTANRMGLGFFTMMLVWISCVTALQLAFAWYMPRVLASPWALWIINDAPLYLLGLPLLLLFFHFVPNGPVVPRPRVKFGVGKFLLCLIFCLGATYLINLVASLLITLLQAAFGGELGQSSSGLTDLVTSSGLLPSFIFGVCVPAVGEEFIFRYLIRRKMRGAADRTYVLFSALCFGLFHANLAQSMYAFVIGIVLAWMYVVTDKLWLPMLIHFIVNSIGIVVVPAAANSLGGIIFIGLLVLLLIPTATVFFFVFKKWVFATLLPPTNPAWPYKLPKAKVLQKQRDIFGPALDSYPAAWLGMVRPGPPMAAEAPAAPGAAGEAGQGATATLAAERMEGAAATAGQPDAAQPPAPQAAAGDKPAGPTRADEAQALIEGTKPAAQPVQPQAAPQAGPPQAGGTGGYPAPYGPWGGYGAPPPPYGAAPAPGPLPGYGPAPAAGYGAPVVPGYGPPPAPNVPAGAPPPWAMPRGYSLPPQGGYVVAYGPVPGGELRQPAGMPGPAYIPYHDPYAYFSPYAPHLVQGRSKGAGGMCIGNAGMILFICLAGLLTFFNLIGSIAM